MNKPKRSNIEVQGTSIGILTQPDGDYISLTDIARYRSSQEPFSVINNWMRTLLSDNSVKRLNLSS